MKNIYFTIVSFFILNTVYSQVLYTENFDNHSVGNLGTDINGKTPGQWGWYTSTSHTQANNVFTIVNETGRGKVLDLSTGFTDGEVLQAWKTNLHTFMANRTAGNDVIMFEIDYYTGPMQTNGGGHADIRLYSIGHPYSLTNPPESLAVTTFSKLNGQFYAVHSNNQYVYLPFNSWVKFVIYLDYPNKKAYYHLPFLNLVTSRDDFLQHMTSTNLIQDYPISNIVIDVTASKGVNDPQIYTRNRYDNIKITALNTVPPSVITLSTNEQLAEKFNLYPNPATNVVNITNNENMLVNKVVIYDITGKQLSTQSFNNQAEIQLNVENLASGTYMLYLQTNQGTAVKKLVKK